MTVAGRSDPLAGAGLRRRLAIVVAVELFVFVATRVVLHYLPWTSVAAELIRTLLRIASAAVIWYLLRPLVLSRQVDAGSLASPYFVAATLAFLAAPVLVGNYQLAPASTIVFAVASIPVAVKEEFLFRGVVQNLLERRHGAWRAILASSALFTVWHVGVWEPSLSVFAHIFLASLLLGIVYLRSGSIGMAVLLHATYDAVFCFTPLLPVPAPPDWLFVLLLLALALTGLWLRAPRRHPQSSARQP